MCAAYRNGRRGRHPVWSLFGTHRRRLPVDQPTDHRAYSGCRLVIKLDSGRRDNRYLTDRAHAHPTSSARLRDSLQPAAARPARPASRRPPRSGDRQHAHGAGRRRLVGPWGGGKRTGVQRRREERGGGVRADAHRLGRGRPSPSQTIYVDGRRVAARGRSVSTPPSRFLVVVCAARPGTLLRRARAHTARQSIICARSADTVPSPS